MTLPPLLSVEEIHRSPERASASISPDGTRIAFLAPWKNRLNVWVENLDGPADTRCVTADESRSVTLFEWTDDPRLLLYLQDDGGDENWHLFRVDLDDPGAEPVDLTPFPGARVLGLDQQAGRPGTALLHLNARDTAEFDLHEVDLATGELTLLARNPGDSTCGFVLGADGVYAHTTSREGVIELSRLDPSTGHRTLITTIDGADHPVGVHPFESTPDGTGALIGSHRGSDRLRLVRIDLATGEETEIDSHPQLDLDTRSLVFPSLPPTLIRDRQKNLLGVRYLGERQVIHALDPHFAEVLQRLEELSDGDLASVSTDTGGGRWVVSFTHDRDPGATWFYDHSTGESRLLFRPYPHLDPDALAPMRPVTVTARDGLQLPSYLTLPVGVEPSNLPLVLTVHGGPWTRDSWGFNKNAQVMANRGYAVLQVNFRGSTG